MMKQQQPTTTNTPRDPQKHRSSAPYDTEVDPPPITATINAAMVAEAEVVSVQAEAATPEPTLHSKANVTHVVRQTIMPTHVTF